MTIRKNGLRSTSSPLASSSPPPKGPELADLLLGGSPASTVDAGSGRGGPDILAASQHGAAQVVPFLPRPMRMVPESITQHSVAELSQCFTMCSSYNEVHMIVTTTTALAVGDAAPSLSVQVVAGGH